MTALVPGLFVASLAAVVVCALLSWWFVWRYSRVRRSTPEGKHLMRFTVLLGATFTATAVVNIVPTPPIVRVSLSALLFWAIAAELYTRNVLLHEAQRDQHPAD